MYASKFATAVLVGGKGFINLVVLRSSNVRLLAGRVVLVLFRCVGVAVVQVIVLVLVPQALGILEVVLVIDDGVRIVPPLSSGFAAGPSFASGPLAARLFPLVNVIVRHTEGFLDALDGVTRLVGEENVPSVLLGQVDVLQQEVGLERLRHLDVVGDVLQVGPGLAPLSDVVVDRLSAPSVAALEVVIEGLRGFDHTHLLDGLQAAKIFF